MSVRQAVLELLVQRPSQGYELHAAFKAVAGGEQNWNVKPAQVYSTLTRLQGSGQVVEKSVLYQDLHTVTAPALAVTLVKSHVRLYMIPKGGSS